MCSTVCICNFFDSAAQHEDVNFVAAMQVLLLLLLLLLLLAATSRRLQTVGEYFDDFVMDCVGNWLPSRCGGGGGGGGGGWWWWWW